MPTFEERDPFCRRVVALHYLWNLRIVVAACQEMDECFYLAWKVVNVCRLAKPRLVGPGVASRLMPRATLGSDPTLSTSVASGLLSLPVRATHPPTSYRTLPSLPSYFATKSITV